MAGRNQTRTAAYSAATMRHAHEVKPGFGSDPAACHGWQPGRQFVRVRDSNVSPPCLHQCSRDPISAIAVIRTAEIDKLAGSRQSELRSSPLRRGHPAMPKRNATVESNASRRAAEQEARAGMAAWQIDKLELDHGILLGGTGVYT